MGKILKLIIHTIKEEIQNFLFYNFGIGGEFIGFPDENGEIKKK